MSAADEGKDILERLTERFRVRCRDDLAILEEGPDGEKFAYCIHRLAGSAGTFGFAEISRSASQIDEHLRRNEVVKPEELDKLISQVRAIL
jgi:HPt (histidine-containing phosphotransfer) domain-containing protein